MRFGIQNHRLKASVGKSSRKTSVSVTPFCDMSPSSAVPPGFGLWWHCKGGSKFDKIVLLEISSAVELEKVIEKSKERCRKKETTGNEASS
jgi:hypothetical protein